MKILAVNEGMEFDMRMGLVREYSSAKELKRYLKNRPWISSSILKGWRLYSISPDGSKLPMPYGIRTMHDFVEHYKI